MDKHLQKLYLPEGGELIKRSKAIHEFFHNKMVVSKRSEIEKARGKTYDQLDEELQGRFLNYQLSIDLFVSVSRAAIRQSFRRLNSYIVSINLRPFGEVELDFTHHNAMARRFSGARG